MNSWPLASDVAADATASPGLGMKAAKLLGGENQAAAEAAAEERWFAAEIKAYEPGLRAWLQRHFSGLTAEIDDVVQESYLRLFRARQAGLRDTPRRYLYGIARYVALEACRRQARFAGVSLNEAGAAPTMLADSDVVGAVSRKQEAALVSAAIQGLPKQCREVAMLHTQHGLSYREIAGRLQLSEATVRVHMALAVRKCAAYVRRLENPEEGT